MFFNYENSIDADVSLRGKILGDLFGKPSYNISLLLKDVLIDSLSINRISINLKGNDILNLDTTISGKYNKNLFWAKGKFDLLNLRGDLRGRLSWNDFVKFSPYFNWKGSFSSWFFEIYSKKSSLRFNSYSFEISDFRLVLDSNMKIDAHLFYLERGNYLYAGLQGTLDNWGFTLWGENLDILGQKLKEIRLVLNNKFLGKINIKLREDQLISSGLELSLEKKMIFLKDILFNNFKLGDLSLVFMDSKVNVNGNILGGKVNGYYSLENIGSIKVSDLKVKNININGEIDINKDFIKVSIPQLEMYGLSLRDITGKIYFNNLSEIKDICIVGPYGLKIYGDLKAENGLLETSLRFIREEIEIGKLWGRGNFEKMNIEGLLFDGNVIGILDILNKNLELRVSSLNLSKIDNLLKGVIDELDVFYKDGSFYFNGEGKAISLKEFTFQDVVFKGEYKEGLNLEVSAIYELFKLTIEGDFNFREKNKLTLFLEPKLKNSVLNQILKIKLSGEVFDNFKNYKLSLIEHNIKGLLAAYISIDLDKNMINGKMDFNNNGRVDIMIDLEGNGDINFYSLSLDLMENFNLRDFKGSVSGSLKVKNWNIEQINLEGKDLTYSNLPINVDSNIKIKKEANKYLVNGEIRKLSDKPGIIKGAIFSDGFDFILSIDNFRGLENFIPKTFLYYGDVSNARLQLQVIGDSNTQKIKGSINWDEPFMVSYIKEKIKEAVFGLTFRDNKLVLDNFEIYGLNNVIKLTGNILPNLDINIFSEALCLSVSGLFNGYIDLDLKLSKDNDRYKIGGIVSVSNGHIYYPQNINTSELSFNIPIDLNLRILVKDNVLFSESDFVYIRLLGEVIVKGAISRPILDGKLNFISGSINVLGNDFIIREGYLKFPGLSFQENIWEISAVKNIQGYDVILKGLNLMGNTSFIFSSEPPLSFREILFLLLGQKNLPIAQKETWTLSTLVESIPVGVEGIISTAFGNYILYPILSELEKVLSLDKIKVDYVLEGLIPRWKSVSFEKRIFNNLFLNLSYSLEGDKLWKAELGYQFDKNLYFKLFTSDSGDLSLSFEYSTQF